MTARSGRPRRQLRRGIVAAIVVIAVGAGAAIALAGKHIESEQAAYGGPQAPRCVPEQLNVSDVLPETSLAVNPMPGSFDAMPQAQISMLGAPARDISQVSVTGSETGSHPGRLIAYSQGDGASFVPAKPFRSGEIVTVSGTVKTSGGSKPFSFHFGIAYPDPIPIPAATPRETPPSGSVLKFHSAPQLEPPAIYVTTDSPGTEPGDIFLAPYSGPGLNGPAIYEQKGHLIWEDPLSGTLKATNLQVQEYQGKPVLTWWQGNIPPQGFGLGEEIVANTAYEPILHIKAGNGDQADLHDFHLESDNTAVLTVFQTIHCDLAAAGGPRDGAVTDALYQEVDLKTGLVRRQWDSVDHVAMSLSVSEASGASVQWPYDYFHLNTIDPQSNGTTLVSSRNTSALYILDTKTGVVQMRIGGKDSEVKMEPGSHTAFQHDAMVLPDGDISIFDNGGAPFAEKSPLGEKESRGVIIEVNTQAKTDTLIRELKHSPSLQAGSQGNVEQMQDGGWFVGWGQEPYFSEYNAAGEQIYDAHMWAIKNKVVETESYRAYKFPWQATPHWPPSIAAEAQGGGTEVYASWNGATEVASWRILAGSSPNTVQPVATVPRANFETAAHIASAPYVQVEALDAAGATIGTSKAIKG